MSATKTLRDALMLDLADITVANGFNTTIATSSVTSVRHDEVTKPAAAITAGAGGDSELDALTNLRGLATQSFTVELFTDGATAEADMDDFTDDVRDAVERSAGNLQTTANVEMVAATSWTEPRKEVFNDGLTWVREVTVEVRYLYTRGSL